MNLKVSNVNKWSGSFGWSLDGEYERDEGNDGERLNFNEGNNDDSGELANLVVFLCNVQGLCTVKEGKIWSNKQ